HRIAVLERRRIAIRRAEEGAPISREQSAGDQPALPSELGDGLPAEEVRMGERFGEVDTAGPVLRARVDPGFDDQDGHVGLRETDGGADAGRTGADDDCVVLETPRDAQRSSVPRSW